MQNLEQTALVNALVAIAPRSNHKLLGKLLLRVGLPSWTIDRVISKEAPTHRPLELAQRLPLRETRLEALAMFMALSQDEELLLDLATKFKIDPAEMDLLRQEASKLAACTDLHEYGRFVLPLDHMRETPQAAVCPLGEEQRLVFDHTSASGPLQRPQGELKLCTYDDIVAGELADDPHYGDSDSYHNFHLVFRNRRGKAALQLCCAYRVIDRDTEDEQMDRAVQANLRRVSQILGVPLYSYRP